MSDSRDLLIHRASHRAGLMETGEFGQEKEWQRVRAALAAKVISPSLIHTPGTGKSSFYPAGKKWLSVSLELPVVPL